MATLTLPPVRWVVRLGLALGLAWLSLAPASAQDSTVTPGERVRVTLPCDPAGEALPARRPLCEAEGTVVRFTPDTLEMLTEGSRDALPVAFLTGLEVRRVEGPDWWLPTGAGLLLGGVGAYVWLHGGGSTSLCDRTRNQDAMSGSECVGMTLLGGVAGAGLGALIARLLRTERWMPVPLRPVGLSVSR